MHAHIQSSIRLGTVTCQLYYYTMGLCKCPKRRVTNLFCFVHRVNVCEDCMVSNHATCVVQSYLKWLEDSDYDAVCVLCSNSLHQGPVVRLLCYDVVHQSCLDKYGRSVPSNTTPAGYTCPRCKERLFPLSNMVSPVAQQLRAVLKQFTWALDILGESVPPTVSHTTPSLSAHQNFLSSHSPSRDIVDGGVSGSSWPSPTPLRHQDTYRHHEYHAVESLDTDDDKYKRKSPLAMLTKWARNHQLQLGMDGGGSLLRRYLMLALLLVLVMVTMILLLTRVGRGMASKDPALDWRHNPNLRTGD